MAHPLYIHGIGLLTGLDTPTEDTWHAMIRGRRLSERGVVHEALLARDVHPDRAIQIAIPAASSALTQAGWSGNVSDIPLFVGSSKGLILTALEACALAHRGLPLTEHQAHAITFGPAAVGDVIARHFGFAPGTHTSVAACASGLHALHRARMQLQSGECRRAIVLAADASLHPLLEGSFDRLGLLAPRDSSGARWCEPFSAAGAGFFLSEAAAALAISADPPAHGPHIMIEQTWLGADAGHLLAIDSRTASLHEGLNICCNQKHIDFIHAHATGTAHDAYEQAAIRDCAPGADCFSSKYWLGHSLGAAGMVSLALSALCHSRGRTLTGQSLPNHSRSATIAQGFGGHIGIATLAHAQKG